MPALFILKELEEYISYEALVAKLKQRYDILEQQHMFCIQLREEEEEGGLVNR